MCRVANKSIALMLLFLVTLLVVSPDMPLSPISASTIEFERSTSAAPADEGPNEIEIPIFIAEAFALFVVSTVVLIRKEEGQRYVAGVGATVFVPPKVC